MPATRGRAGAAWRAFEVGPGAVWGEESFDVTIWFRATARVPQEMRGKIVAARLHPDGESLCYVDGTPVQGLDHNRKLVRLTEKAKGGERFEIVLESYNTAYQNPGATHVRHFDCAEPVVFDQATHDFYWDAHVAVEVSKVLEETTAHRSRLINLVHKAVCMVEPNIAGTPAYDKQIRAATRFLREGLKEFQGSSGWGNLTLTGHAHIDTAWLWPLRETKRKCGRTFSSVLKYMEQYPEYCFSQSQPQLYEYIKEHYPDIYAGIKKRVKEGRWEICGAGWVEEDNNVPSGESLIRQFMYGNRFFEREFGIRSRVAWLPDSFGYTWALPQILKKAGIDYFVTNKISWCQYNSTFPYSLFWWQGVDGTRIPAYLPVINYNGNVIPKDLRTQWETFQQKDIADELGFSFGWGDGGGGPTVEMIETGKRLSDVAGIPKVQFGKTEPMLERIFSDVDPGALPTWNGELYLEYHRGCQTTQAHTKRFNRKCEHTLRDAEFANAWASLYGHPYDHETLYDSWKTVLLNQFHDILPGSSVTEVYTTAEEMYAEALRKAEGVRDTSLEHLATTVNTEGDGTALVVFNSCAWIRNDVVEIAMPKGLGGSTATVIDDTGDLMPSQIIGSGKTRRLAFLARNVPAMGYATYWVRGGRKNKDERTSPITVTERSMENGFARIRLDGKGRLTSIFDKWNEREVLPRGERGNTLRLYDDRPHNFDAWDIDFNYADKSWDLDHVESIEVIESGPVRGVLRIVRKTEASTIAQDITLYRHTPRIDFTTHVDWHEKKRLLKAVFPVDVLSSRATYEIQYGAIERTTHGNTAYDRAQFEVPAHRWADLSETGYGVALLNDCKYGYAIDGNVMTLSLLRATDNPDEVADQGEHEFTYAILPHSGTWQSASVVRSGAELNAPLQALAVEAKKGRLPNRDSLVSTESQHVIIDTVKKAEDSRELIVRLYEAHGQRGEVTLTFCKEPKSVCECNLIEEADEPVEADGSRVTLQVRPYDLRTLKVRM